MAYTTSTKYKNKIYDENASQYLDFYIGNEKINRDYVKSMKYDDSIFEGDSFSLGSTIISSFEIVLSNEIFDDFETIDEFKVNFTLELDDGEEIIPFGNYIVKEKDSSKNVVEYDEVLRKQREVIYGQRKDILFLDDMEPTIRKMIKNVVKRNIGGYIVHEKKNSEVDAVRFMNEFASKFFNRGKITIDEVEGLNEEQLSELIENKFIEELENKKTQVPNEVFQEFLKVVLLRVVDSHWMDHIDQMSNLRQSIGLQSYAQINPLREYQQIAFETFNDMIATINDEVVLNVNRVILRENLQREEQAKVTGTNAGADETAKRKPVVNKDKKVGRNDPCPCGSGKKYKYCCGMNEK